MDIVVDGCCLLAGCQRAQTADEIERLRQQNAKLAEALQKIVRSNTDDGAWQISYETIMRIGWGE